MNERLTQALDYLSGYGNNVPTWVPASATYLNMRGSRLWSPPKFVLGKLSPFLYGGGVQAQWSGPYTDDQAKDGNHVVKLLDPIIPRLTERLAYTGSVVVLVGVRGVTQPVYLPREDSPPPTTTPTLTLEVWDAQFYKIEGDTLILCWQEGYRKWRRYEVNSREYRVFPPHENPDVLPTPTRYQNPYGRVWAQIGETNAPPIFTEGDVEAFFSALVQMNLASEYYRLYAAPLIVATDVKEVESRLSRNKRVLPGSPDRDLADTRALTLGTDPASWREFRRELKQAVCETVGISFIPEDTNTPPTGPPLRIMHQASIQKAEALRGLWDGGVSGLLEVLWNLGYAVRAVGSPYPAGKVTFDRRLPYFPDSIESTQVGVAIAAQLRDLGVDPAVALQNFVFPDQSLEEVRRYITGDPAYA